MAKSPKSEGRGVGIEGFCDFPKLFKYLAGADGVSGLGEEARRGNSNTDFMFNMVLNPLKLVRDSDGQTIWINPAPASSCYQRPTGQTTLKYKTL